MNRKRRKASKNLLVQFISTPVHVNLDLKLTALLGQTEAVDSTLRHALLLGVVRPNASCLCRSLSSASLPACARAFGVPRDPLARRQWHAFGRVEPVAISRVQ